MRTDGMSVIIKEKLVPKILIWKDSYMGRSLYGKILMWNDYTELCEEGLPS